MSAREISLSMRLIQKTAQAVKVTDTARIGENGVPYQIWWLPRSQLSYSRTEPAAAGELPIFTFKAPAWLAAKHNLNRFEVESV